MSKPGRHLWWMLPSLLECALTAEHKKGKHSATNWACIGCLLRLLVSS